MILKHVGWSVVVFGSIPKSNFWSVDCTQVSDSGPLGLLFSAPEPKAQVHYCDHASSVVCLRPSLTFHIFDFSSETTEQNSTKLDRKQELNMLYQVCVCRLKKTRWPPWPLIGWDIFDFSSETAERNSTKLDRKQDLNILTKFVFLGRSEKQDGHPGLWLAETFSTSPPKPLNGIHVQWNLTGGKISTSSTKFVFFGPNGKDCRPGLWLAETFSTSPLKPLNRIQRNLTGSKISMSSTKIVFFGSIGKTRWPSWSLIGWDIFDFSSETAERNSTKLDRQQYLNVLYQVCVLWDNQ